MNDQGEFVSTGLHCERASLSEEFVKLLDFFTRISVQ
jgi:hypothetical protein